MHDRMSENFVMIGMRVVRGPGWKWGDQDGGEGCVGTIVELEGSKIPKNTVLVQWDVSKKRSNFRSGLKGLYDLYVLDSAPAEIKHEGYKCVDCGVEVIRGTRWQCKICEDTDFCTPCYMKVSAVRCMRHSFLRHDTSLSEPVLVDPRNKSDGIQSRGLFKGARVMRGENWKQDWRDQDGGAGNKGTIISIRGVDSEHTRSVAIVKWDNGNQDRYRVGCKGKVDLYCDEPAPGMYYYPSHLALCGYKLMKQQPTDALHKFKTGDYVCFNLPDDLLKDLLEGHGGWSPKMPAFRGKKGVVHRITDGGDVRVQYWEHMSSGHTKIKFTFHPAALESVPDEHADVLPLSYSREVSSTQRDTYDDTCSRINQMRLAEDVSTSSTVDHSVLAQAFKSAAIGDLPALRRCVDVVGLNLLRRVLEGFQLIHIAAKHGRDAVIQFLKEKSVDMNAVDARGNTALHHAVLGKNLPTMKFLIRDCGVNINAVGGEGSAPLHIAASEGFIEGVTLLLTRGAEINIQDSSGNTALHVSVNCNWEAISEILCSNSDIDLSLRNMEDMSALHLSAVRGSSKVASMILSKSSREVNQVCGSEKKTPLHLAVERRHHEVAKIFLEQDTNVDVIDALGNTPLHSACAVVCLECAELLVRNGADPKMRNGCGESCLDVLVQSPPFSRTFTLSQNADHEQINDVIQRHQFSNDGTCDVKLFLACYITFHGCSVRPNFNHVWKKCLLKCSEAGITYRNSKNAASNDQIKSLEEKLKQLTEKLDETLCGICFDRPKNLVLFPCKHTVCKECSERLLRCPHCRKNIENRVTVF